MENISTDSAFAFLASRLNGLEDVRNNIYELGVRAGRHVWVSEISASEIVPRKTLDEIQVLCLKQVRTSQVVICVIDGSFGTTWNDEQISIFELELATAAFSKRDIWIFLLKPFDSPDRRILSLLESIKIACPSVRIKGPITEGELYSDVDSIVDSQKSENRSIATGLFVQDITRRRAPFLNYNLNLRDVQFLDGRFSPLLDGHPDASFLRRILEKSRQEKVIPVKLAKLWVAFRHLSTVPYIDRQYEKYLPFWIETLSQWSSASAWYALHGHFYLGRLAAINTLFKIRSSMSAEMLEIVGQPSIFANNGAVASEYYSIAKLIPSWRTKLNLLRKALWNCNIALKNSEYYDSSGLLDIRGHIKLMMLNPVGGISDLKRALQIRNEMNADSGAIGESEVHLGRAYAACHLYGNAERLLEAGIAKLKTTDRYPFIVQGLRHMGAFYSITGRYNEAANILQKASLLASKHEIQGQLHQIEEEVRRLKSLK